MDETISRLADRLEMALSQEESIYRELIELSDDKRQALIHFDAPSLQTILEREQDLLDKLMVQEESRYRTQKAIEERLDLDAPPLRVDQLQNHISPERFQRIRELKESLNRSISIIKAKNEQNAELIHQSLNYIQFSLDAMGKVAGRGYTADGKTRLMSLQGKVNQRG